ncbi:MAG: SDR family NAD(P)-dependent oxidoreductase, partial [Desulfobacterium sp.]|nr:SDR family NAD(P)-dependent oxidoreductase [Desulfobacterium sp.]MBU4034851.1 SDR family NAD(P)-dependent oxidoreductase [Pseudomonadota bacterium]
MTKKETAFFVVTGAASGMGAASALRLGRRGKVLLVDIDAKRLDLMTDKLVSGGIKAEKYICDLMDEQSVCLLAETAKSMGRVIGLVNAAGISPSMTSDWRKVLSVDLVGTALMLREFLPLMVPGAAAVCIASIAARAFISSPETDNVLDNPLDHEFLNRI